MRCVLCGSVQSRLRPLYYLPESGSPKRLPFARVCQECIDKRQRGEAR